MTENTTDNYIHLSPEALAVIDEPDHVRIAFMRHERFVVDRKSTRLNSRH